MDFKQIHESIRETLRRYHLGRFVLTVSACEYHPNRSDIQWSLYISREPLSRSLYFTTGDPARFLPWMESQLGEGPSVPSDLDRIGEITAAESAAAKLRGC